MPAEKIAVIGAGNMGSALLRGILASGWGRKARLAASHPKKQKASALARELGIRIGADNAGAAKDAGIVILAVKPQILESVLLEIRRASATCARRACRPTQRTVALDRTTAATLGIARMTGIGRSTIASIREVETPAAIERRS